MTSIEYCLDKARAIPYTKGQSRHYACLVDRKGRVVAESANSYTLTHTKQFHYAKRAGRPEAIYLHSEISCILKDRNRKGVKLFVVRIDSKGKACYSAPCEVCSLALKEYTNIKSIEYSI